MPFLMFVITTILTLCIGFGIVGLIALKYIHLKNIKQNWPNLNNAQMMMRYQRIINYRMNLSFKTVSHYYENLIMYAVMLITFGITIGGYLIGNLNLALIPLVILGLEISLILFTNLNTIRQINHSYKDYIRDHLDNELMVVTIPEPIVSGMEKIRIILGWLFIFESGSILIIILELNQIIN